MNMVGSSAGLETGCVAGLQSRRGGVRAVHHPNGTESLSPGLRGTSYPGCRRSCQSSTLQGLHQLLSISSDAPIYWAKEHPDERAATLTGLLPPADPKPRVARSSQPWAERCNPFGIERSRPTASKATGMMLGATYHTAPAKPVALQTLRAVRLPLRNP